MKATRAFILFLSLLCTIALRAEVLVLQSGAEVQGTIVFQNEEVVIIKTPSGARYQYPTSEIKTIRSERKNTVDTNTPSDEQTAFGQPETGLTRKKVSVAIEVAGGAAALSRNKDVYGNVATDLLVGSHNLLNRSIFLGGCVG